METQSNDSIAVDDSRSQRTPQHHRRTDWLLVLGAIASVGGSVWFARHATASPEFGLVADNQKVDLGKLRQQEKHSAEFLLTNRSSRAIRILRVHSSCGCTVSKITTHHLEPDGTAVVSATVSTSTRRGDFSSNLTVVYTSQGDENPQGDQALQLKIAGNVVPSYDVKPTELSFADGGTADAVVSLVPRYSTGFRIAKVFSSHPAISITDLASISGARSHSFIVHFDPKHWLRGDTSIPFITIRTNEAREPTFTIRVNIHGR